MTSDSIKIASFHRYSCVVWVLLITFLGVRAFAAFAFFPVFLVPKDFLPLFSGEGERIVSGLLLAPRFLARSSGWILGRTPPLAMVTPFSNCRKRQCTDVYSFTLIWYIIISLRTIHCTKRGNPLCMLCCPKLFGWGGIEMGLNNLNTI